MGGDDGATEGKAQAGYADQTGIDSTAASSAVASSTMTTAPRLPPGRRAAACCRKAGATYLILGEPSVSRPAGRVV